MFKIYEVDPDADTLLIVPHTTRPFAPWEEDKPADQTQPPPQQRPSPPPPPTKTLSPTVEDASSVYAGILRGTSRPYNPYARAASSPPPPPPTAAPAKAVTIVPETRIKVSSRHLSLASRRLRDKLRHSATADADSAGRTRLVLPADRHHDPAAVVIVMDAVHGRGRKVPRALGSIEALARVAAFVDEFRCLEAVEVYAERWVDGLLSASALPGEYGRDLVLWLYVSYVFRRGDVFALATRTAVLRSDTPLRGLGLNVREGIIKEIDLRRQQLVRRSLELVNDTIDALQEDKASCALGCDTFLLGALIKTLSRRKLVWPRPARPFVGVSFVEIVEAVRGAQAQVARLAPGLLLDDPVRAQKTRKSRSHNAQPGHALTPESSPEAGAALDGREHECAGRTDLTERLGELGAAVEGLELESKLGFCLY